MPLIRRAVSGAPAQTRSRKRLPLLGGRSTAADVSVDPERSLQIGAVYSCVRLLSESVASLPVGLYRRSESGRVRAEEHPLSTLVSNAPNPVIDSGEFWRTIMGWMLLRGNAYAYIQRSRDGQPLRLWPLSPASVDVQRADSGELVYVLTPSLEDFAPVEAGTRARAQNMMHFRAFGLGVEGLSPVSMARQQIGISYAAMSYVGGFFARDASPGGVVSVEGELGEDAYRRLEEQWRDQHEGFERAHRLAVLEGGAKWQNVSLSPVDAAFLDTYKLSRTEIAAIYGVPPHMIGDLDRATFSNIEQQSIDYVVHSLRPWLTRLERVTGRMNGLGDDLYLRFNVDGLLRGDIASRYGAYAQGRQWGWLSTNDVRRLEDMDPVDSGDVYLQPLNMIPAGSAPPARYIWGEVLREMGAGRRDVDDTTPDVDAETDRLTGELADVVARQRDEVLDALGARDVTSAFDTAKWDAELTTVINRRTQRAALAGASGVLSTWNPDRTGWSPDVMQAYLHEVAGSAAQRINRGLFQSLVGAYTSGDGWRDATRAVFDNAEATTEANAAAVTAEAAGFGSHDAAAASGLRTKTWRTTSTNPRAEHARLNGETVAIGEEFGNGLRWPGDSRGSDDKTAGCRCRLDYGRDPGAG